MSHDNSVSKLSVDVSELLIAYDECIDGIIPHVDRLRKVAKKYNLSVRAETNNRGEIDIILARSI